MLDEQEYQQFLDLMQENGSIDSPEKWESYVKKYNIDATRGSPREIRFKPILDAYKQITGLRITNVNAIWHHRISTYGPTCLRCGKVLRTPVASKCFECGLSAKGNEAK